MNALQSKMLFGAALITATACTPPEGDRFFV